MKAWPSDPHHALNLYIPNKRPRGAPRIVDLPGNWNKMWGRTPEADYLDYGTINPGTQNGAKNQRRHRIKAAQSFRYHPARVKSEFGEPKDAPNVIKRKEELKKEEEAKKKREKKKEDKHFKNVPTQKDKKGNVFVRPGMTRMSDKVDADGRLDADFEERQKAKYAKEHNIQDTNHPFKGLSNPLFTNMMMTNPGMRLLMPMMMNKGNGMGIHKMLNDPYMNMMNMMNVMNNPHFLNAVPYASLGYNPNLFGHGMPIYHGTQFENKPLNQRNTNKLRRRTMEDAKKKVDQGGYHGGLYQNGAKHPLHSPWRVKMRRCRLKNGQRVIFPASQVNMDKFDQICNYDPNAPDAQYSIDINTIAPVKCFFSMDIIYCARIYC